VIRPTLPQHALWPGIHGSVSHIELQKLVEVREADRDHRIASLVGSRL
jgi:hypothetical protein